MFCFVPAVTLRWRSGPPRTVMFVGIVCLGQGVPVVGRRPGCSQMRPLHRFPRHKQSQSREAPCELGTLLMPDAPSEQSKIAAWRLNQRTSRIFTFLLAVTCGKYGAESRPAVFFLGLVVALFLVPAAIFHLQVRHENFGVQYPSIKALFIADSRCSFADTSPNTKGVNKTKSWLGHCPPPPRAPSVPCGGTQGKERAEKDPARQGKSISLLYAFRL